MINVKQTIISQYATSPTLVKLIENVNYYIDPRANIDDFYSFVMNINTAQGFGLDILGRIVGVSRVVPVPSNTPNPGAYPYGYTSYQMTDAEFKLVILAKAALNISDMRAQSINKILSALFVGRGRCYVNDLGDMTMRYTFEFYLKPWEYALIYAGIIAPRPAAVYASILQIAPGTTFGFLQNVILQPFNQGTFYTA